MTDQTKQKLKYWLIGLISGGAVTAPVTAFITKKVYEKKIDEAETRGMNEMAKYAIQQQNQDISKQEEPEEKTMTEEDYVEEEPSSYDVSIDDIGAEEPTPERSEAHEKYLDMIEQYRDNQEMIPYMIDAEKFLNEQYMTKSYVNWYEEDDVFEEDLNTIDDPYSTFGKMSGKELFKNSDSRPDPDICYVRNPKSGYDFEISRIHGSYAKMVRGEERLGETNS